MEELTDVKVKLVRMRCPKCGKGYMKQSSNFVYMSYPPKYDHTCDVCGHTECYTVSYPAIRFIDSETGDILR